jgi:hypothetical protein
MWECPRCGRKFEKTNQWHSCGPWTSEYHLKGKSTLIKDIYRALGKRLNESGIRIDPGKTAISLWKNKNYATIYVQKQAVKLEFLSRIPISNDRIERSKRIKDDLYFYTLKLRNSNQVDDVLIN